MNSGIASKCLEGAKRELCQSIRTCSCATQSRPSFGTLVNRTERFCSPDIFAAAWGTTRCTVGTCLSQMHGCILANDRRTPRPGMRSGRTPQTRSRRNRTFCRVPTRHSICRTRMPSRKENSKGADQPPSNETLSGLPNDKRTGCTSSHLLKSFIANVSSGLRYPNP